MKKCRAADEGGGAGPTLLKSRGRADYADTATVAESIESGQIARAPSVSGCALPYAAASSSATSRGRARKATSTSTRLGVSAAWRRSSDKSSERVTYSSSTAIAPNVMGRSRCASRILSIFADVSTPCFSPSWPMSGRWRSCRSSARVSVAVSINPRLTRCTPKRGDMSWTPLVECSVEGRETLGNSRPLVRPALDDHHRVARGSGADPRCSHRDMGRRWQIV